jgi:hypothetical protein
MPVARPLRRTFLLRSLARSSAAVALVLVALLGVAPGRASALEPPRPLPGYRAGFVTETDERPWRDCLWASAAMLLDKWTNGDVTPTHQRLRTLSGDRDGGSSLEDLRVALRKLGFKVELDADGDATMTWGALLRRLKDGGGAVVLGDYGQLPSYFGRWDYRFWKGKGTSGNDNHAVYVERYDPRRGVVWLMDPLGRGGYEGEWLSISSLQRYAWFTSGRVQAVATPSAKAAPFAGVRFGGAAVAISDEALVASWELRAGRRWRFQGADVRPSIQPDGDPVLGAALTAAAGATITVEAAPHRPQAVVRSRVLRVATALPEAPGAYTSAVAVVDRRFGRTVARSMPATVFVPGDRRATLRIQPDEGTLEAGGRFQFSLTVANSGTEAWAALDRAEAAELDRKPRPTRVVATWIRVDGEPAGARAGDVDRVELEVARLTLHPGRSTRLHEKLPVPVTPGRWALVVDLVNEVDGSFAAFGSAPAVALFDVIGLPAEAEADPTLD